MLKLSDKKLVLSWGDINEVVNQHGLRGSANATTIATVGGLDWGETLQSAESGSIINNIPTGRRLDEFVSDAKRINSVANVDEEFIITEEKNRGNIIDL